MFWVYDHYNLFNSFNVGIVFRCLESDVYKGQILKSKVDPHIERVNSFII